MDDRLIRIVGDPICCDIAGEAVILSLKTGQYYGLDAVGARIWTLLQEPKSMTELLQILTSEFDVESGRCEQDVTLLLGSLSGAGLVEIGP